VESEHLQHTGDDIRIMSVVTKGSFEDVTCLTVVSKWRALIGL